MSASGPYLLGRRWFAAVAALLVLSPLGWTPPSRACNARKADSIHAHSHARPSHKAFLPLSETQGLVNCSGGRAGIYDCQGVDLLSFVPLSAMGAAGGETGNDVWGWTDPVSGREYALMGLAAGVSFVDISDPQAPVYLGKLPSHVGESAWRDIKVYRDHALIVADRIGPHGMQVFDLTQLRDVTAPRTFQATARYGGFGSAHNIAINEATGFAYALGSDTCRGGLHMIDVGNPRNPRAAGCFDADGYTHDTQCVIYRGPDSRFEGREICFNANEDTLTIVDVTDKAAPQQLARLGYEGVGYAHQGWLTDDHRFLLLDDEQDERRFGHRTRTYLWNVEDLAAPRIIGIYDAPTDSIDHNLYVHRGYVFQANYRSGLRVLTLAQIAQGQLREIGFFDIVPESDVHEFGGSWSVYPFFDSGNVIVSNIEQGLFILRPNLANFAPPLAPNGLAAAVEGLQVSLSWRDNSRDEQGFRVYRTPLQGPGQGQEERVAQVASGVTTFTDAAPRPATTYRYRVAAFNGRGEGRSLPLDTRTAQVLPVSAEIELVPPQLLEAGRPVQLRALATGPAVTASWRFGSDGVALEAGPCAENTFCATWIFPAAGAYEVSVEVVGDFGQKGSASASLEVAPGTTVLAAQESLVQSVVLGPKGDTGIFKSNLWLYNSGTTPALVELAYLPRGIGEDGRESRRITLSGETALFLPNVLETLFAVETGLGSVAITTLRPEGESGAVRVFSRSFVELKDGSGATFGQFVGEDRGEAWSQRPKAVAGILEGDGFIGTLLVANLEGESTRVTVELFDAEGGSVGEPALLGLGARVTRSRRVDQLFPQVDGRVGPFTARFTSSGGRFAASATLLEARSEDQIFLPALEEASAAIYYLPRVARGPGQFDVRLDSLMIATNESAVPTRLRIEFWERGQNNLGARTVTRSLAAGETKVYSVVKDLFDLEEGTGALRVTWENAEGKAPRLVSYGLATSAAAGGEEGLRFGMLVGGLTDADAVAERGVQFGAEQSDLFKSSYGVVNLNDRPTRLVLTLKTGEGTPLATAELSLRPRQHLERNLAGIFEGLGTGANWVLVTEVVEGGPVLTYLANINASGDVFFVPGAP